MSWLHLLFGVQGASYVIGVTELATALALIAGAFNPVASALGAAMSCATYLITLSFFLSTPRVAEPAAGGFPAISAPIGQFLLKDLVLLAASVCLLLASVRSFEHSSQGTVRASHIPAGLVLSHAVLDSCGRQDLEGLVGPFRGPELRHSVRSASVISARRAWAMAEGEAGSLRWTMQLSQTL
jgi:hypothetical protein